MRALRWWLAGAVVAGVSALSLPIGARAEALPAAVSAPRVSAHAEKHDYAVTVDYSGSVSSGYVGCNGSGLAINSNDSPPAYFFNHFGSCEIHYHWSFGSRFDAEALAHSNRFALSSARWDADSDAGGTFAANVQYNCIDVFPYADSGGTEPGGNSCKNLQKPWTGTTYARLYRPWLNAIVGGRPSAHSATDGFNLKLTSPIDDSAVDYTGLSRHTDVLAGPESSPSEASAGTGWYAPIWNVVGQGFGCVFDYPKLNARWERFYRPRLEVRIGEPRTMHQTLSWNFIAKFPPSGSCSSYWHSKNTSTVGDPETASMLLRSTVEVSLRAIH